MERIEKTEKTCVEVKHNFFCDNCEKPLGSTVEYEDGYYQRLGEFELSFHMPDGWYTVNKCFCDKCKEGFIELLRTKLINMGFENSK